MANPLSATTDLIGGMAFRSTTGSGHTITMDAKPESGGDNQGGIPMEVVLQALSACTGMDVISILRKMRQDVSDYRIEVHGERVDTQPAIFSSIAIEHIVRGRNIDEKQVARAIELSATKYCSVGAMLGKAVPLADSYRIIDDATGVETTGKVALTLSPA